MLDGFAVTPGWACAYADEQRNTTYVVWAQAFTDKPSTGRLRHPALDLGAVARHLQPQVDALREVVLGHNAVHADETPVQVLMPSAKKTHRAYVWAYATTASAGIRAVVYDLSPGRSGEYARNFLQAWKGKLV